MIKINLLPYREKEKKENLKRRIIIVTTSIGVYLLVVAGVYFYFSLGIGGLERSIREENAKLVILNKKVGDVEARKREKQEVEAKLGVIKAIEGNRLFPVQMLDELNLITPSRDIWMERISQTGNELRIEGVARNTDAVARFMKNLEAARFIQTVDLMATKEKEISGSKLQQFILTCVTKKG